MAEFVVSWEKSIVQKGHTILDKDAQEIPLECISLPIVQDLIRDMHAILATQDDGVALAAPQIGASVQMFIVSPKVFSKLHPLEKLVYINPVIVKTSKEVKTMQEGCLSVRGLYGKTVRHARTTVRAYDETGRQFTRDASGLLSQIFQHEIDHLHGVLFDEHAVDLYEVEMPDIAER
jgi:peptide deformylase